jgi:RHS repeat-associated protein
MESNFYYFGNQRVARKRNGVVHYFHSDQIGSAIGFSDATGAVAKRYMYGPYGILRWEGGVLNGNRFGMAGERLDDNGLYQMGVRKMSPTLGIFITPDPSEAPDPTKPQSLNRFAYANNSPVNLVDPTGFEAEAPDQATSFSGQNHLFLVGGPGNKLSQGRNFMRGAETQAERYRSGGANVSIVETTEDNQFANALTQHGKLDSVQYFGHGNQINLFLSHLSGDQYNLSIDEVAGLNFSQLKSNAILFFWGCHIGGPAPGEYTTAQGETYRFEHSLAQEFHQRSNHLVAGFSSSTHASNSPNYDRPGPWPKPKDYGPIYWVPDDGKPALRFGSKR